MKKDFEYIRIPKVSLRKFQKGENVFKDSMGRQILVLRSIDSFYHEVMVDGQKRACSLFWSKSRYGSAQDCIFAYRDNESTFKVSGFDATIEAFISHFRVGEGIVALVIGDSRDFEGKRFKPKTVLDISAKANPRVFEGKLVFSAQNVVSMQPGQRTRFSPDKDVEVSLANEECFDSVVTYMKINLGKIRERVQKIMLQNLETEAEILRLRESIRRRRSDLIQEMNK